MHVAAMCGGNEWMPDISNHCHPAACNVDYLWASMPPIHVLGGAPIVHPATPNLHLGGIVLNKMVVQCRPVFTWTSPLLAALGVSGRWHYT